MLKKNLNIVTSVLVVLGLLAFASPAFALIGTRHAKGKVIAMNRRTHVMTVRNTLGTRVNLRYSSLTTRIWHNGVRVSLSRLHVGNRVDAAFIPSTSRTIAGTASDVNDNEGLSEVSGTVAAVDTAANTISIASEDGGSTVILKVDSTTVITRNGAPATLGDLLFGDQVDAKYDSATMLASSIKTEDNTEASEVEGTIKAVDTTANTVTISGDGGSEDDAGADVTLNVNSSTVIMLDGSPAPLSSLQVGFQADAEYDPGTMNASFIEAESH